MTVIDVILIVFGLFTLVGVIFKPEIYWERGRIKRTREVIGDTKTAVLYLVVGLVMLIVGVLGFMGAL